MAPKRTPWLARSLLTLLLLAALIGAAVYGYLRWSAEANRPKYFTVAASKGTIVQAVTATGTLNPVLNVQVGSQISGIIQKLYADFNSPVTEGQLIAQIDPGTYQAAVTQAEGELANACSVLDLAMISAQRARKLLAQSVSAQSDVDAADAAQRQAEAQVKIKQGALDEAQINLERCTINAPINGIVISRNVDVGQTVAASLSAPVLFAIANDLTKMQIDANVAEADVGVVEVGQKVDFTVDAFPYRTFHGTITQVRNAPLTVQNVVTYDTVIGVNNADLKLKPGMTANVSIIIASHDDVLKVPNSALRVRLEGQSGQPNQAGANAQPDLAAAGQGMARPPGKKGAGGGGGGGKRREGGRRPQQTLYILPNGDGTDGQKPQPREVQPGITDGISTEILSGLNEGDQVVTSVLSAHPAAGNAAPASPFGGPPRR